MIFVAHTLREVLGRLRVELVEALISREAQCKAAKHAWRVTRQLPFEAQLWYDKAGKFLGAHTDRDKEQVSGMPAYTHPLHSLIRAQGAIAIHNHPGWYSGDRSVTRFSLGDMANVGHPLYPGLLHGIAHRDGVTFMHAHPGEDESPIERAARALPAVERNQVLRLRAAELDPHAAFARSPLKGLNSSGKADLYAAGGNPSEEECKARAYRLRQRLALRKLGFNTTAYPKSQLGRASREHQQVRHGIKSGAFDNAVQKIPSSTDLSMAYHRWRNEHVPPQVLRTWHPAATSYRAADAARAHEPNHPTMRAARAGKLDVFKANSINDHRILMGLPVISWPRPPVQRGEPYGAQRVITAPEHTTHNAEERAEIKQQQAEMARKHQALFDRSSPTKRAVHNSWRVKHGCAPLITGARS